MNTKNKKFWTVLYGVIGTAHMSRENQLADFRPARSVIFSEVDGQNPDGFYIIPAKGVIIKQLFVLFDLDGTKEVLEERCCNGMSTFMFSAQGTWNGAEVKLTKKIYKFFSSDDERNYQIKKEKEKTEREKEKEKFDKFLSNFGYAEIFSSMSKRDKERLGGKLNLYVFARKVAEKLALDKNICIHIGGYETEKINKKVQKMMDSGLKDQIQNLIKEERIKKREEYFSRKG